MATKSEFSVAASYPYNLQSPARWLASHAGRYWPFVGAAMVLYIVSHVAYAGASVLVGRAAELILNQQALAALLAVSLAILGVRLFDGVAVLLAAYAVEVLAKRVTRDAREELVASLLGKSQTFHDRQRVGDLMARATDDMDQISGMIMPGISLIFDSMMGLVVPLLFIGLIDVRLLLVPLLFSATFFLALRGYMRELNPVTGAQRAAYGELNSRLEESLSGIEVVKASAQEAFERQKFRGLARRYRDLFVQQGRIEARYLPLLLFGIAYGLTFTHALLLYRAGQVTVPDIVTLMGLMLVLRFPTFISIFTFSLVQLGLASARRVLAIIQAETELDENRSGHDATIQGDIRFENLSFGYDERPVLEGLTFHVRPGQTVAIVGQTGSGKSTLTQLVNRTYDATAGRVLVDGVDVRDWKLDALRSQISKIEQDLFLFSRTVGENIAFGTPHASQAQIEQAARDAQAHDFILGFNKGYDSEVGERGVTLSGGQRQRIALARAFLSDPRILILDDSTSAVDSATEDEIQKAMRRAQQGRTTLLITHRLAQIRWADLILVLDEGRLVASGNHDTLLEESPLYRRIFARFE